MRASQNQTMRIAVAGFQHETNTFAPGNADLAAFCQADSWPALLTHEHVISGTRDMNLPISGAITRAEQENNIELVPILWCAAEPCGHVTTDAFETISKMILNSLELAGDIDAIYLDLHGAMVTQNHDDGEGELLRRLRICFPSIPIGVSLDLHANISSLMIGSATVMSIYRTYPHLDMAQTGARCMHRLIKSLNGARYCNAFRQMPFLVPLHAQYTGQSPCRELYLALDSLVISDDEQLDLAMGFTAADIPDCGPAIVASAQSRTRAEELANELETRFIASESVFDVSLKSATEAVTTALQNPDPRPVVIADVQDNAGAGGTADTTGLLQALIQCRAADSIIGVLCDADVASKSHMAGIGGVINCSLGAKASTSYGNQPVSGSFTVEALSDGNIRYTGAMYAGSTACIGKSCLLALTVEHATIRIVVSSQRTQCLDCALFNHFGVDLAALKIICVKSTVHFRADFEPLASEIIAVKSPGAFACDLNEVEYTKLRADVRRIARNSSN